MKNNELKDRTSISLKQETIELLKTVKSCFQIGRKVDFTYDELIAMLVTKGLEHTDAKVFAIFKISSEDDNEFNATQPQEAGTAPMPAVTHNEEFSDPDDDLSCLD